MLSGRDKTKVFDNGGKTFDRYTIVHKGEMYGASQNPFHPQGFGTYCGDAPCGSLRHLGKRVPLELLPEPVQRYVKQIES